MWSAQASSKTYPTYRWPFTQTNIVGGNISLTFGAGQIAFDPNTRIGYYKISSFIEQAFNVTGWPTGQTFLVVPFPTDGSIPTDITGSDKQTLVNGNIQLTIIVDKTGISVQFNSSSSGTLSANNLSGFFFLDA